MARRYRTFAERMGCQPREPEAARVNRHSLAAAYRRMKELQLELGERGRIIEPLKEGLLTVRRPMPGGHTR